MQEIILTTVMEDILEEKKNSKELKQYIVKMLPKQLFKFLQ